MYEDKGVAGLNQYIGSAEDVAIKAQYKVGGVNYSTAIDRSNKTGSYVGLFMNNTTVKSVTFEDGISWMNSGNPAYCIADSMFKGCTALERVVNIPPMLEGGAETNRSATGMYAGCVSVVDAPVPMNVKKLKECWRECAALTKYAAIPETVTSLMSAFASSGIVDVPDIPDSVTTILMMCHNAKSVESVGVIGSGVTNMNNAFYAASKLSGVIRIESTEVSNMASAFPTSLIPNITFEVPADSTTYATLLAAYPTANVTTF